MFANSTSNYTFDQFCRIGNDNSYDDVRSVENSSAASYMLTNYWMDDPVMNKAKRFATSQPGVQFIGGHMGEGGCNVDTSSKLTIGQWQTHPCGHIDLHPRPYVTVPYLGRGAVDAGLELDIRLGKVGTNRKTTLPQRRGNSYIIPLLPQLQNNIQDPRNLIESVAVPGWVQGGIDTRNQRRDMGNSSCAFS